MGSRLLICGALCLATAIGFHRVVDFDFVDFDDPIMVTHNPMVSGGFTSEGLRWALTSTDTSNFIPLTRLSHMLDCTLFGLDAGHHHLVNVLWHVLDACLLFFVLLRLTRPKASRPPGRGRFDRVWASALVAGLFAVHPAHVEPVAWIAYRKDLLSTFFFLFGIWGHARYAERLDPRWRFFVFAMLALGLLAKPLIVTLPFVLLLLDYWPLDRFPAAGESRTVARSLLREKIPLFVLAAAASVLAFWTQSGSGAVQSFDAIPPLQRLANALLSYVRYLGILFWPSGLAVFYPFPDREPAAGWLVAAAAALLAALSAATFRLRRRHPYLLVGWLWYLGTLVPVIGLVQVGEQSMADRYTYIPFVGLFIAIAWGTVSLWPEARGRKAGLATLAVAVIAGGALLTSRQVTHWKDSLALWERAVAVTSKNAIAHDHLAATLLRLQRLEEALDHSRRAVALRPDLVTARNNLGSVLFVMAKKSPPGHEFLSAAANEFRRALELDPSHLESKLNLAIVLHSQRRFSQATDLFGSLLESRPEFYEQVRGVRSVYADSLRRELLSEQVGLQEAVEDHERALRLFPDWPEVVEGLAWALATHPDATPRHGAHAVEYAVRASAAEGQPSPAGLDRLAAAYAAAGRFEEAVSTAQLAAQLAEERGYRLVAERISERLQLYRAGERYREESGRLHADGR